MAYLSSTNGSSANPPSLTTQGIASQGIHKTTPSTGTRGYTPKTYEYNSTHTTTEVTTAGFFTDGKDLGMSLGDELIVVGSTTYARSMHIVNAVSSTGVSVSTGTSLS